MTSAPPEPVRPDNEGVNSVDTGVARVGQVDAQDEDKEDEQEEWQWTDEDDNRDDEGTGSRGERVMVSGNCLEVGEGAGDPWGDLELFGPDGSDGEDQACEGRDQPEGAPGRAHGGEGHARRRGSGRGDAGLAREIPRPRSSRYERERCIHTLTHTPPASRCRFRTMGHAIDDPQNCW